jgi:hypothetical protein
MRCRMLVDNGVVSKCSLVRRRETRMGSLKIAVECLL